MISVNEKVIKNKIGLLRLAQELNNVSKACRVMGYSRDTFYRYKEAVESGGIDALFEKTRRQPNLKNRLDERVEKAILDLAMQNPALGQGRVANELRRQGFSVLVGYKTASLSDNHSNFGIFQLGEECAMFLR